MAKHHQSPDLDGLGPDPNLHPEPVTEAHELAAAAACRFLGQDFPEGSTICYQGGVWVCRAGAWSPTDEHC
jgi:hypothetical protein